MELENKETNERYIRKDIEGGYIYNKSEINYFRQVQRIDVANNLMLGDYNQNGAYTLNSDLIDQLVGLTKVYQYSFGTNMFCQSLEDVDKYGKIDFAIKIVKDSPKVGQTTAILELLEPIDKANGYYTNTNTAQISSYTAPETNTFVVDVLKVFNVISKKDTGLVAKKRDEIDLIVARKQFEEMRKNLLEGKLEEIYKDNFNKKLKLLSKSPVGKKILDEFNAQSYKINGWFVKEGMKGYHKTMDELLQSIIEKNKAEILTDVKLMASLNKTESDFSKLLFDTLQDVDKIIVNSALYGENIVMLTNNQKQLDQQNINQNSKEEVKINTQQITKKQTVIEDKKQTNVENKKQEVVDENKLKHSNHKVTKPKQNINEKKPIELKNNKKENVLGDYITSHEDLLNRESNSIEKLVVSNKEESMNM